MKLTSTHYLIFFIIIVVGGLAVAQLAGKESGPGKYDELAQCISDQGATFYGAFWCPHCNDQKALFGKSESKLPYVECSTPDGQSQIQACSDAGITSYPTWRLEDGTELPGVQTPADLAAATGCQLPADA